MDDPTLCCLARGGYCNRCDLIIGVDGLHVTAAERDARGRLVVTVESEPAVMGCPSCGVLARGHGRDEVELVDAPVFGAPVRIRWRKRRWVCPDLGCPVGSFTEQDESVAAPRAKLTTRACRWAIEQIRREHASVNGVRRQLGTSWSTVWSSIKPILAAAADDESRFEGVSILGVDEHVWHHVSTKPVQDGGRGPKELTGMVDLTRDEHGKVHARLLDLVPGRSGETYRAWLTERGEAFHAGVEIATLDPFHGYKNAIDDQLEDARSVLDASTSSNSPPPSSTTSDAACNRTSTATAAARMTRSTGSGTSFAPAKNGSPTVNASGLPRRGLPTNAISRSKSPGCVPNRSATATTKPVTPTAVRSPRRCLPRSSRARSPRSSAWARP